MKLQNLLPLALCFVALCFALPSATAQSVDFSKVKVSSISETQMKNYALQLKSKGVTLEVALAEIQARGASDVQIEQLRSRLSKYLPASSSSKSSLTNGNLQSSTSGLLPDDQSLFSQKKELAEVTEADKMVFGFSIFNKDGLTFEPNNSLAVSDNYIIGIGDGIDIDIYGAADNSYQLTVSADGTISVPMVGPIKVAGLKLSEARTAIKGKMRSIYGDMGSSTDASIRISSTRPITVSIMGEAFMPGTFTVSSAATLFHVLYLCGGPNSNGSYRDIQLIRGGKIVKHLDVYDFLLNGKDNGNVALADGDMIMIPTYQKRVAVGGAFKRNGYFEAKEGESVSDLIRFAGGFNPYAMTSHIGMRRMGRYATEYKAVQDPSAVQLANGDSLFVAALDTARMDKAITVEGAVFSPGTFEYKEGVTLGELLDMAGGLTENAFKNRGVITRFKEDYTLEALNFDMNDASTNSIALKENDVITIVSIDEMRKERIVTITGEVNAPGAVEYRENMTLGDLLILAGGLTEDASQANIEILRRLSYDEAEAQTDFATIIKTVQITRDLTIGSADNEFIIEAFDQVIVRPRPSANQDGTVSLSGAFLNPGDYGITSKTVRLSELITRAGLNSRADIGGARIYRRIILEKVERDLKLQRIEELHLDTASYLKQKGDVYELLSINLEEALQHPGSDYDVILKDRDQIIVPEISQSVRITGMVQNPTSMSFKNKSARAYIKKAGGFASRAKKSKTYVVYPNGQSASTSHFLFIKNYPDVTPGSEVVVPEKPESTMTTSAIVSMSSSIVSMIAVIVALIK